MTAAFEDAMVAELTMLPEVPVTMNFTISEPDVWAATVPRFQTRAGWPPTVVTVPPPGLLTIACEAGGRMSVSTVLVLSPPPVFEKKIV